MDTAAFVSSLEFCDSVRHDWDSDGDVDVADLYEFILCYGDDPPSPECLCHFDHDEDGDVDFTDYQFGFVSCYNGPGQPPQPWRECRRCTCELPGGGEVMGAGGGGGAASLSALELTLVAQWCYDMLTVEQRAELAGRLRATAPGPDDPARKLADLLSLK